MMTSFTSLLQILLLLLLLPMNRLLKMKSLRLLKMKSLRWFRHSWLLDTLRNKERHLPKKECCDNGGTDNV
jgi:hypothetical protein